MSKKLASGDLKIGECIYYPDFNYKFNLESGVMPYIDVSIKGDVGDDMLLTFYKMVEDFKNEPRLSEIVQEIRVNLFSYGGDIDAGLSIIDFVNKWNIETENKISFVSTGCIASMGIPIMLSGDKRYSYKSCRFLIHDVSCWLGYDRLKALEENMIGLVALKDMVKQMFKEKTKMKKGEIDKLFDKEHWFGSKEALEYGIIDEIYDF